MEALGQTKHQRLSHLIGVCNGYEPLIQASEIEEVFLVSRPYNGESHITICIHLKDIGIYKQFFLPPTFLF